MTSSPAARTPSMLACFVLRASCIHSPCCIASRRWFSDDLMPSRPLDFIPPFEAGVRAAVFSGGRFPHAECCVRRPIHAWFSATTIAVYSSSVISHLRDRFTSFRLLCLRFLSFLSHTFMLCFPFLFLSPLCFDREDRDAVHTLFLFLFLIQQQDRNVSLPSLLSSALFGCSCIGFLS
jgi:hypothetical protein